MEPLSAMNVGTSQAYMSNTHPVSLSPLQPVAVRGGNEVPMHTVSEKEPCNLVSNWASDLWSVKGLPRVFVNPASIEGEHLTPFSRPAE